MQAAPGVYGSNLIRCRIAACREALADDASWSFHLINDGETAIHAELLEVASTWGDESHVQCPLAHVQSLAPATPLRIWRDDGEVRLEFVLQVRAGERVVSLRFEFPKLYAQRALAHIEELGVKGWQVGAQA